MDELQTLIKEQLQIMPDNLRNFITGNQWASVTQMIATKNNFSPLQKNDLDYIVLLTLTGLAYKEDLEKTIKEDLSITDIMAHTIREEIYTKIIKNVETLLPKKNQNKVEPTEKPLLEQAEHVLQSKKVVPQVETVPQSPEQKREVTPQSPPPQTQKTPVDETLGSLIEKSAADTEWLTRKNSLGTNDTVIQKKYPGQDPYREPVN